MGLRDAMNQNSTVVTVITVVVLIVCMVFIGRGLWGGPSSGPRDVYYFDLNSGKVFVGEATTDEFVEAPSGPGKDGNPAGVKAMILSCDKCRSYEGMDAKQIEESGARLAYLLRDRMPPPAVEGGPAGGGVRLPISLVRAVDGDRWLQGSSQQGMALMTSDKDLCKQGQKLKMCKP